MGLSNIFTYTTCISWRTFLYFHFQYHCQRKYLHIYNSFIIVSSWWTFQDYVAFHESSFRLQSCWLSTPPLAEEYFRVTRSGHQQQCYWLWRWARWRIITWLCDILALVWHFGPACVTFRPGLCDILALSCVTKASACHHTPILTTVAVYRKFHRSSVSKAT